MQIRRVLWLMAGLLVASPVGAQDPVDSTKWHLAWPTVTSAGLANLRATFLGTAGLSWPNGSQTVVTFWRREGKAHDTGEDIYLTYRCEDHFNASMQATGAGCYMTGAGRIPD
jgi:hypothetical protein